MSVPAEPPEHWLRAGTVGRAHGLDGSFHVGQPMPGALTVGVIVTVAGRERAVVRRAGLDARPIVRLEGCEDREAADALRGQALMIARDRAPALADDEYYAHELEGCEVADGPVRVGTVRRMLGLPSCEVLEVQRAAGGAALLVPLIKDAVRSVDVASRRIEVNLRFLGEEPDAD